jgi:hypothetical protein
LLATNLFKGKCQSRLEKLLGIRDKNFANGHNAKNAQENGIAAAVDKSLLDISTYSVKTLGDLQNRIRHAETAGSIRRAYSFV